MKKKSGQLGWKWSEVKDPSSWKIPDGSVMRLIYLLHSKNDAKIYDLGCGIGRHTIFFSSQGYQVSAIDISEEVVERTKKWLIEENLTADVQQGPMTQINQPDNAFDLVISINVIYHAFKKDIIKTISEIFRILKPGGLFYGTFLTKRKDSVFTGKNILVVNSQTIITKGKIEKDLPHFFSYIEDILEFFKNFEIVELTHWKGYHPPFVYQNLISQERSEYFKILVKKPLERKQSFITGENHLISSP